MKLASLLTLSAIALFMWDRSYNNGTYGRHMGGLFRDLRQHLLK